MASGVDGRCGGERVATTARRGAGVVADALRVAGLAVVAVLVLHILLTVVQANPENGLTMLVADLVGYVDLGLSNLFLPDDPALRVVLNYGTAAVVWLVVTTVVVRLVRRVS
jgi:hypothetical protein